MSWVVDICMCTCVSCCLCCCSCSCLPCCVIFLWSLLLLHMRMRRWSTSYCLDNSCSDSGRVKGPTGRRRRVKGGVSGLAEKLRPVSEVETRVNFRLASGVRRQVAGSLPGGNQAQVPCGTGMVRSHLPSTRRFLISDSRHLDVDGASGNRWAGRRCVEHHSRRLGC